MKPYLVKSEWDVRPVTQSLAKFMVSKFHYAKGGSDTAVYREGLFRKGSIRCWGVAWWIPPTKSAALSVWEEWRKVLALSRLVVDPNAPKNAASYLIGQSIKLIDSSKWECLVTYADFMQGHTGAIYRATNWEYLGETQPQRAYKRDGKLVSRKAGPKTRTHKEMLELGCEMVGRFAKHKFMKVIK